MISVSSICKRGIFGAKFDEVIVQEAGALKGDDDLLWCPSVKRSSIVIFVFDEGSWLVGRAGKCFVGFVREVGIFILIEATNSISGLGFSGEELAQ